MEGSDAQWRKSKTLSFFWNASHTTRTTLTTNTTITTLATLIDRLYQEDRCRSQYVLICRHHQVCFSILRYEQELYANLVVYRALFLSPIWMFRQITSAKSRWSVQKLFSWKVNHCHSSKYWWLLSRIGLRCKNQKHIIFFFINIPLFTCKYCFFPFGCENLRIGWINRHSKADNQIINIEI